MSETRPDLSFESEHTRIPFAHGDVSLKLFQEYVTERGEDESLTQVTRNLLERFYKQQIGNITEHRDQEKGVAYQYTEVRPADDAKALFVESGHQLPSEPASDHEVQRKYKVTFPSVYGTNEGHPATFMEYAMDEYMKTVASAVRALERGEEPDDVRLLTLCSPMNAYGDVSAEWARDFGGQEFEKIGRLYADLLEKKLTETADGKRTSLQFTGLSGGGTYAMATAAVMLEDGVVTQEHGNTTTPYLQVLADSPAGESEFGSSFFRRIVGFVREGINQRDNEAFTAPAKAQGAFMHSLEDELAEKGMKRHMEPEEGRRKWNLIRQQAWRIAKGQPVAEGVKVFVRIGSKDPLFPQETTGDALEERLAELKQKSMLDPDDSLEELDEKSILRTEVASPSDAIRKFIVPDMPHTVPWFRPRMMETWTNTAKIVASLQRKAQ